MLIKVLIFGQLTDLFKVSELNVEDVSDKDQLVRRLTEKYPAFAHVKCRIAIDKKLSTGNETISNNSVVALLPPFSGG